jgi:hypothetical protein
MSAIDAWLNIIRREAQFGYMQGQGKSTVICTSYNPQTHAIKGILVPHGIETGWIPVGVQHAGNGFGILTGPNVGSAGALDGDQFDVEFEFGDPNSPMATHKRFSTADTPPQVQSGEILVQHKLGHSLSFKQDGSVTIYHAAKGGMIAFDGSGNMTVDAKGQTMTIQSSGGAVAINGNVTING